MQSQVCERNWLRAPGSTGQSLKTPVLVIISLVYIYSTCFPPLGLPLLLPRSHFCCHGFSFFALIHTFYSYLQCFPSSCPHLQCLLILQKTLKGFLKLPSFTPHPCPFFSYKHQCIILAFIILLWLGFIPADGLFIP